MEKAGLASRSNSAQQGLRFHMRARRRNAPTLSSSSLPGARLSSSPSSSEAVGAPRPRPSSAFLRAPALHPSPPPPVGPAFPPMPPAGRPCCHSLPPAPSQLASSPCLFPARPMLMARPRCPATSSLTPPNPRPSQAVCPRPLGVHWDRFAWDVGKRCAEKKLQAPSCTGSAQGRPGVFFFGNASAHATGSCLPTPQAYLLPTCAADLRRSSHEHREHRPRFPCGRWMIS